MRLEQRLSEVKENLCKLVTVTGQTKSGKTVLTRKMSYPLAVRYGLMEAEYQMKMISGMSLWKKLDLSQTNQRASSHETTSKFGAKGSGGIDVIVAKGSGEVSTELAKEHGDSETHTRSISPRVTAISGLHSTKMPLVIDDFHYLPRELQGSIVRALKPLIFDGLAVVIIAIPHRPYDALKVEKEMTGRIDPIQIPVWSDDELQFIPDTGFDLLQYSLPPEILTILATELSVVRT